MDKRVLNVKYTRKTGGIHKARLVVFLVEKGFQLRNTYTPVFKLETLKILLSYCCRSSLQIEQIDVQTAFLNGKGYKQPLSFSDKSNRIYKLHKAYIG